MKDGLRNGMSVFRRLIEGDDDGEEEDTSFMLPRPRAEEDGELLLLVM